MTEDRPGFRGEPDFDDPAYAPISELLASARVDGPIPVDVASRLDATLAELNGTSEPKSAPDAPLDADPVVPLRRRPRIASRLLAAAAVLGVLGAGGVGLSQVLGGTSGSDDSAASGSVTAADRDAAEAPAVPGSVPSPSDGLVTAIKGLGSATVPVLTSADFSEQSRELDLKSLTPLQRAVARAESQQDYAARSPAPTSDTPTDTPSDPPTYSTDTRTGTGADLSSLAAKARSCSPPAIDGVALYPIIFDGKAALLVVHPASAGTKLVQAWSCDGSVVLASTTVPA